LCVRLRSLVEEPDCSIGKVLWVRLETGTAGEGLDRARLHIHFHDLRRCSEAHARETVHARREGVTGRHLIDGDLLAIRRPTWRAGGVCRCGRSKTTQPAAIRS